VIAGPNPAASQSNSGSKLVGAEVIGPAEQGWSVALSADGKTAIVGGIVDKRLTGAVWVFTRSRDVWTQQGAKLVGTGAVGQAGQGCSIAISADGQTAIIGGAYDNRSVGAAWVFARSGDVWTQQGSKLLGIDALGAARQGSSVALSANGDTAIVGGVGDNSGTGAAWAFARRGGVWIQQGAKMVGTGAVGSARQGSSVALSADGETAVVGGVGDNSYTGAAWAFTSSGGVWTQQGAKLVGTGAVGSASQGHSVALSADGSTAMVGGPHDNSHNGAAWAYTRSVGSWAQQGAKMVGTGAVGKARQGSSVALSADGNTAIEGGISDDMLTGAAWIHTRNGDIWTPGQYLGY
jgi:hypothetical protein